MLLNIDCKVIDNVSWINSDDCNFLAYNEVAVWRISITAHLKAIADYLLLLSPDELQRAGRYHHQKDRDRFTVSRGVLRNLLGRYLDMPATQVEFETTANKKPFVKNAGNVQLHYNISHSGDYVLIAIASSALGIDVEQKDMSFPFAEVLVHSFSAGEIDHIQQSPMPVEAFYKLWTRKEALLKATGKGIDDDMKLIPCLDGEHTVEANIIKSAQNWYINTFDVMPNYACSLASDINIIAFFDGDF